jgi:hypothetical protein
LTVRPGLLFSKFRRPGYFYGVEMLFAKFKCLILAFFLSVSFFGCATLPEVRHQAYRFPKDAHIHAPTHHYETIGMVRSRIDFPSLEVNQDFSQLCKNYFNSAAHKLVRYAKQRGADAVIDVRSVVFLLNGEVELHPQAECVDDGAEGQILAQGIAVKWLTSDRDEPTGFSKK